jgi:hypothetical protein
MKAMTTEVEVAATHDRNGRPIHMALRLSRSLIERSAFDQIF